MASAVHVSTTEQNIRNLILALLLLHSVATLLMLPGF
jgi:hypothetical protein